MPYYNFRSRLSDKRYPSLIPAGQSEETGEAPAQSHVTGDAPSQPQETSEAPAQSQETGDAPPQSEDPSLAKAIKRIFVKSFACLLVGLGLLLGLLLFRYRLSQMVIELEKTAEHKYPYGMLL